MDDRSRPLIRWLQSTDPPAQVLLGCDDAEFPPIPADAIGVRYPACLSQADLSLPAQLLAFGVTAVRVTPCRTNPESVARTLADWCRTLDGVGPLAEPSGRRRKVRHPGPVLDLGRQLVSRRLAFGLRPSRAATFDLDLDEAGRGLAALRLLQEQGRARLNPVDRSAEAPAESRPVALGLLADGCTACGVCVSACPHDALELVHGDGVSLLTHLGDRCRAERVCIQLCPVTALSESSELDLAELAGRPVVELARVATRTCGRCGGRHPEAEGDLCGPCRFRAANPFGSSLPPGFARP